jgi:hypothetical protein
MPDPFLPRVAIFAKLSKSQVQCRGRTWRVNFGQIVRLESVEPIAQLGGCTRVATRRPPEPATPTGRAIEQLQTLRAIGVTGAWVVATEIFGWRQIGNRRQLEGLVGLVPAPVGTREAHAGSSRSRHRRYVLFGYCCGHLPAQPPVQVIDGLLFGRSSGWSVPMHIRRPSVEKSQRSPDPISRDD